ncbi:peptide transporter family 1-like isoform X2 [Hyposmocoma kahamanoa]|nr:peptide transporter family 1-like isoform X2 [Hyposmocoma kahamanoa]
MRAFLTLYLRSKLGFSDDISTEIYHIFNICVYIFPIIGGILADNYLGKYRTILYMMFVYAAGNVLVAITAIPYLELPSRLCTIIALFMITFGAGGIKPCVTAFGGDQFKLPEQERHLAIYFSVLYFVLCTGSLIAKTVSPILRSEVHCFGDKDCYSLAFGAPGLIVLLAIVIFVSARSNYVLKKPEGNVLIDFVKCVSLGLKNRLLKRTQNEKQSHWLDSTKSHFDQRFINDIKRTLSILTLFAVVPVFWALLDQMGSRWTLQAARMDGRLGFITIKPDQLQVIAPIAILVCIPVFTKFVYPPLEKRNILKNPLHKMTLGGVLAGVAFIASGTVEIYLKTTYPQLPQPGYSQLRIFNGNPCPISVNGDNISCIIPSLSRYINKHVPVNDVRNISLKIEGSCIQKREEYFLLKENAAISFFVTKTRMKRYFDDVNKSKAGFPMARFLVTNTTSSSNLTLFNEKRNEVETILSTGVSLLQEVFASRYSLKAGDDVIRNDIELESGGVYTIIINEFNGTYKSEVIVVTEANSVTMALLLPQFIIIAIGEVLFAVTGNEFAFKESPESMKAVMTAVWLMTEAAGNVIIIVITRLFANYAQETQSFIYTGLMLTFILIFYILSRRYRFSDDYKCNRGDPPVHYLQVKPSEDCL